MESYFNYFTEIEEHYQRRRGTALLLSTLDWALIETWKNAGVPLEAVLRGIDEVFDKYDQKPSKTKKVNSLAYCSQAILAAAEELQAGGGESGTLQSSSGFDLAQIATFLRENAGRIQRMNSAALAPERPGLSVAALGGETATTLYQMAAGIESSERPPRLEDLERRLTVLEEKLLAVLMAAIPDEDLVEVRAQADRDIAPYRRNMNATQVEQLHQQYVRKHLLERSGIPRLSLFYMR